MRPTALYHGTFAECSVGRSDVLGRLQTFWFGVSQFDKHRSHRKSCDVAAFAVVEWGFSVKSEKIVGPLHTLLSESDHGFIAL